MRILQVCSVTTFGGGERHLADLSHALTDLGHDVYAASVPGSPLWDELSFLDKGHTFALSRFNYLKNLTGLAGFVRANDIEIVHAHAARDYHLAALVVRLASHARLVLTRHALFPLKRINSPLLKCAARVIAVSQAVAESLRRNRVIESAKITVVHNGIDVHRFNQPVTARNGDFPVVVGTLGHLAPIKGHDVFIRAAAQVIARRPDVRFLVIGEDKSPHLSYRRSLESLVAELNLNGTVTMPGWRDDIPEVLSSLTLFVSAARSEPFGLAIVEAMAARLPVIATASEGATEIIEDGHNGKLVPADNPEALAQAINNLLDDPLECSRLARNAQLAARDCYSLERMARDTERVYRDVVLGRGK
ncbi:MAG TPA: glycosyltransferase family 4 protein [Pyrinomonadaceae bacterium]|nr:glycosyltransferase family 4 protein [Pyrinomonadaceae bacterium]